MYSTGNTPFPGVKENVVTPNGWGSTAYRVWLIPYEIKNITKFCILQYFSENLFFYIRRNHSDPKKLPANRHSTIQKPITTKRDVGNRHPLQTKPK